MIRKIVISAAGQGTRMLFLTKRKSKHLINVLKRPFITYLLDNILAAGYSDLILVIGYGKEKWEEFLKDYKYNLKVVNQFEILGGREKEYGTACPIKCVKDIVGKENFVSVYGDNLFSIRDLKEMKIDDDYNYVAGYFCENPEKYGILKLENGFLKEIVEKPKKFIGNLINAGLYKFTPEIFEKIREIKISPRGEYELTDAINLLAKEKKVKVKEIKDYWFDFGNPGDILKVSKFLKNYENKNQKS
jgi:dTDP-glucose pyrophosphorylase